MRFIKILSGFHFPERKDKGTFRRCIYFLATFCFRKAKLPHFVMLSKQNVAILHRAIYCIHSSG